MWRKRRTKSDVRRCQNRNNGLIISKIKIKANQEDSINGCTDPFKRNWVRNRPRHRDSRQNHNIMRSVPKPSSKCSKENSEWFLFQLLFSRTWNNGTYFIQTDQSQAAKGTDKKKKSPPTFFSCPLRVPTNTTVCSPYVYAATAPIPSVRSSYSGFPSITRRPPKGWFRTRPQKTSPICLGCGQKR